MEDIEKISQDKRVIRLDVRTKMEYAGGHVDGFVNIPVDELRDHLDEISQSRPVYVMCQSGLRSYIACRILSGYGYECYNFAGGYRLYSTIKQDRCLIEKETLCGMDLS